MRNILIFVSVIYYCLVPVATITLVRSPQNQTGHPGSRVLLQCHPDIKADYIFWKFRPAGSTIAYQELAICQPGNICSLTGKFKQFTEIRASESGDLRFEGLKRRNNGEYQCMVLKQVDIKAFATITVLVPPALPTLETNNTKLRQGDKVLFTCTSRGGNPPPQISWKLVHRAPARSKNHEESRTSTMEVFRSSRPSETFGATVSSVMMTVTAAENGASVVCTVGNEVGSTLEKTLLLNVQYAPQILPFEFNPFVAVERDDIQRECRVDANPSASVTWFSFHRKVLSDSSLLTLTAVTRDKAGVYSCHASNEIGSTEVNLTLSVHYPPSVAVPALVTIREDAQLTVTCLVDSNPPPRNVEWTAPVLGGQYWRSRQLKVTQITKSNAGVYTCSAENVMMPSLLAPVMRKGGNSTTVVVQYVPSIPRITATPDKRTFTVGQPFSLKCLANTTSPGIPSPSFEWRRGDAQEVFARGAQVQVKAATLWHGAIYRCTTRNLIGAGPPAQIVIDINQAPYFTEDLKEHTNTIKHTGHQRFTVTCAVRAKPRPVVVWSRNSRAIFSPGVLDEIGQEFAVRTTQKQNSAVVGAGGGSGDWHVVSILEWKGSGRKGGNQLGPRDNANYSCVASNSVGQSESSMRMTVRFLPQFTHTTEKVATSLGSAMAILTCPVQAVPPPVIRWRLGSQDLPLTNTNKYSVEVMASSSESSGLYDYQARLKVRGVAAKDLRMFVCIARNSEGTAAQAFQLTLFSTPEPPSDVGVVTQSWDKVRVSWSAGFDGGAPQIFLISIFWPGGFREVRGLSGKLRHNNLTDLLPGTNYSICVYAQNQFGKGDCSKRSHFVTHSLYIPPVREISISSEGSQLTFTSPGNYCIRVEVSRDSGTSWVLYRDCLDPRAKTITLSVPKMTAETVYRFVNCLTKRREVCSAAVTAWNEDKLPDISRTVIIAVACSCFVIILLLTVILLYFCCRKKRVPKNYDPANAASRYSCSPVYSKQGPLPATSPIHLPAGSDCTGDDDLDSSHLAHPPPAPPHQNLRNHDYQYQQPNPNSSLANGHGKPYARVLPSSGETIGWDRNHPDGGSQCDDNQDKVYPPPDFQQHSYPCVDKDSGCSQQGLRRPHEFLNTIGQPGGDAYGGRSEAEGHEREDINEEGEDYRKFSQIALTPPNGNREHGTLLYTSTTPLLTTFGSGRSRPGFNQPLTESSTTKKIVYEVVV